MNYKDELIKYQKKEIKELKEKLDGVDQNPIRPPYQTLIDRAKELEHFLLIIDHYLKDITSPHEERIDNIQDACNEALKEK